jgi:4-hydroxy-tetrahydrodipicolinate synthase
MENIQLGLVHTPITPFVPAGGVDLETYAKVLEFHIRNGADALALPMHAGESVSLTAQEKHALIAYAVKQVAGRVPIIAHASDAGTAIAAALARDAESIGAAAVVVTTPYYWTPPPAMVFEHFAQIGAAVRIPFLVHNAPDDMAGSKVSAELMGKLIGRLENFAGLVDSSLDWQFMIELVSDARRMRPDFQLIAGAEYMVSAAAIGATSMFSALAGVAPRAVRELYRLCREEKLFEARAVQEQLAALRQLVKKSGIAGVSALKAAQRAMGRDSGDPRPPVQPLDSASAAKLAAALEAVLALRAEPRGW